MDTKREPYWVCDTCAAEKKLITRYPSGGNTVCMLPCGYCKRENTWVTPIVDFKTGKKDTLFIWD